MLSVIWKPLLIEINLSQIRTLSIKLEKVCAVCPYLLFFLHSGNFPLKFDSVKLLGLECSINPQNLFKIVGAIFEKFKNFKFFLMWTTLNFMGRGKTNKRYGHTAHTFSRLMLKIIIWERFIFIRSAFPITDNNTFLAVYLLIQ